MSAITSDPRGELRAKASGKPRLARFFYPGAALIILVFMVLGFQQFYLHGKAVGGRELPPPLKTLIILHAVAMTAWVLLFVVQSALIATANRRVHMGLGKFGMVLALAIIVLGLMLSVQSTRLSPDIVIWGLVHTKFMAVPLLSIPVFAAFVAVGVWNRKRPQVHRPMMLLATLTIMPAAVSRIMPLSSLYAGTPWENIFGPYLVTLILGAVFLLVKPLMTRSFNRSYAIGYAALFAACLLTLQLARTDAWDRFAALLLR